VGFFVFLVVSACMLLAPSRERERERERHRELKQTMHFWLPIESYFGYKFNVITNNKKITGYTTQMCQITQVVGNEYFHPEVI